MVKNQIDETDFYFIVDESFYCCDEVQFKHLCKNHLETQGCYFCEFDYTKDCECE